MNSEELEQSLRTEFESYLKNMLADMRQDVSEFQKQFEAEFEKHKTQLDDAFQNFSARLSADRELEKSFTEAVVEHLRLSRDEGARITATAFAEAEEMEKQNAAEFAETVETPAPTVSYSEIRDAVNDISSKTTQSAILKTLVQHAAQFTPRGAFFIIKNEHLVGWRVFGKDGETADEQSVREVFFPVAASTVLGESVRSLSAVESSYGTYSDDSIYLNKLEFGQPAQMYAVPLVVRGRAVAVLYADQGAEGEKINLEGLETLVRVAGLTVEILASARGGQVPAETTEETPPAAVNYDNFEEPAKEENYGNRAQFDDQTAVNDSQESSNYVETETPAAESFEETQTAPEANFGEDLAETKEPEAEKAVEDDFSYTSPAKEEYFSNTSSTDANYSYKPFEQPAEPFGTAEHQLVESDSFAFKPSVEAETVKSELFAETPTDAEDKYSPHEEKFADEVAPVSEEAQTFESAPAWNQTAETADDYSKFSTDSYEIPSVETEKATFEIPEETVTENEYAPSLSSSDYQFESNQTFETSPSFETPSYDVPDYKIEDAAPSKDTSFDAVGTGTNAAESLTAETPVENIPEAVVKQPSKSRFSERNVDLPIEVSEDERRLHNDARRFARLLVSEIKLYNEQKVKEGREGSDLYERLREAIDRSREMYDKRVQPPVAAKFDYFNYELVNSLAEGDSAKLGASYPGANV